MGRDEAGPEPSHEGMASHGIWKFSGRQRSHGRLLVLEEPSGCCVEDVAEEAGLEGEALHGLRGETVQPAWGSGVPRSGWALKGSSLDDLQDWWWLGSLFMGVGSSGENLVVWREEDPSRLGSDEFEVPRDVPEQCPGGQFSRE